MNKISLNISIENHSPLLMKMQNPKDALFMDRLNVPSKMWSEFTSEKAPNRTALWAGILWAPAMHYQLSKRKCRLEDCVMTWVQTKECREHWLRSEKTPKKLHVPSGKAFHPRESMFPHQADADIKVFLCYLKGVKKGSMLWQNWSHPCLFPLSFLFRVTYSVLSCTTVI